jgi:hypothetical protein
MNASMNYQDQSGSSGAGIDKLKSKVGEAVEPVKEKAAQAVREHQKHGASQLHTFAQAIHGAAREVEGQMPKVARLIHDAGDQLDRMAENVKDKSIDEMFRSVRDFARQQPALVLSGAVLAGIVLTRFLKSSANRNMGQNMGSQQNYQSGSRGYYTHPSDMSDMSGTNLSDNQYDTSPTGDYGVGAGRRYDEQTSRRN